MNYACRNILRSYIRQAEKKEKKNEILHFL